MAGAVSVLTARQPGSLSAMDALDGPVASPPALWDRRSSTTRLVGAADSAALPLFDAYPTTPDASGPPPPPSSSKRSANRLQKRTTASTSQLPNFERPKRSGTSSALSSPGLAAQNASIPHKSPAFAVKTLARDQPRKKNLRWLAKDAADNADQIDLSRTVAENEERSGLGISMQSPPPIDPAHANPLDADDQYRTSMGSRAHSRTFSHTSAASNISSGSFKPTVPFVHPYRHSPTLAQGPPAGHADSYFPADSTLDVVAASRLSTSSTRPALQLNTAAATAGRYRSVSHTAAGSSASLRRPRRATENSLESGTPPSRTSLDRAFSFLRSTEAEPLDPIARAATIQAARQAFDERQEAKDRKYEQQERKAAEKAERVAEKKEDRQRRKSEIAEKKRTSHSGGNAAEVMSPPIDIDEAPPRRRRRASAPTQAKDVEFGRREKKTRSATHARRSAKMTNAQFWLWFKTRVVHRFRDTNAVH